jgi:hypothetical protein
MATVTLVENTAGRMFAGTEGGVWFDVSLGEPGTFAEDAAAIAAGDTQDWTVDTYATRPEGDEVAVWENGTIQAPMMAWGSPAAQLAARYYVGIVFVNRVPFFAHKHLPNGEYVEFFMDADTMDREDPLYTVRRCYMGTVLWSQSGIRRSEMIDVLLEWGLAGWIPTLHGN